MGLEQPWMRLAGRTFAFFFLTFRRLRIARLLAIPGDIIRAVKARAAQVKHFVKRDDLGAGRVTGAFRGIL